MKKFLFTAVFFINIALFAQVQWEYQSPLPTGNSLHGIDFADPQHGWVLDHFVSLFITEDGGDNWTHFYDPSLFGGMIDLDFIDEQTGWIVGNKILKTQDGGQTWIVQHQTPDTILRAVCFVDEQSGWAVGDEGLILHTPDGGATWQKQISGTDEILVSVSFSDNDHGWVVSSEHMVIATVDGGLTWIEQSPGIAQGVDFRGVSFADDQHGWIVGSFWGGDGLILGTVNGGTTWEPQDTTIFNLFDISSTDSQNAWIVGEKGKLYRTINGGEDWIEMNGPVYRNYFSICFTDASNGWVSGVDGALIRTLDGGITWHDLSKGIKENIHSVCFANDQIGWVAGVTGIYSSDDGGSSWTLQHSGWYNDIYFTDVNHGHAVGPLGKISATSDGGAAWQDQQSGVTEYLRSAYFVNSQNGWVAGSNGLILATHDGGNTWEQKTSNTSQDLYSVFFTNLFNGWSVGYYGTILHTNDGGNTWVPQIAPPPVWYHCIDVFFLSDEIGWISCHHRIIYTEDAGEHWIEIAEDINPSITSICFRDNDHGWAAGYTGQVIYTIDGGWNWTTSNINSVKDFHAIWFSDMDNGWIAGDDGTILHTDDGGLVWKEEFPGNTKEDLVLVYPNPFAAYTTFEYDLKKPCHISLKIYNSLGYKVWEEDKYQEKGNHQLKWDPIGNNPGIYYYRLSMDGLVKSGKLILIR